MTKFCIRGRHVVRIGFEKTRIRGRRYEKSMEDSMEDSGSGISYIAVALFDFGILFQ